MQTPGDTQSSGGGGSSTNSGGSGATGAQGGSGGDGAGLPGACDPACIDPQVCSVAQECIDPGTCLADGDCDEGTVCDEATKTWTFKNEDICPITDKPVKSRNTLRIVSANEQQLEFFHQLGDEKEMKMMVISLTRKK